MRRIALERKPCEAGGVLLSAPYMDQTVLEMPNRSSQTHDRFVLEVADLRLALESAPRELVDDLVLWHTHPGGNVGPSRDDLSCGLPGVALLVVTLTEADEAIPTWYLARGG